MEAAEYRVATSASRPRDMNNDGEKELFGEASLTRDASGTPG